NGLGIVTAEPGQAEEGLALLRSSVEAHLRTGSRLGLTEAMTVTATAAGLRKLGRYEDALRMLADAEALGEVSGEENFAAEPARAGGVVLLSQAAEARPASRRRKPSGGDAPFEAEACFLRALAIARKQGARGWELRAATSLAALWKELGKSSEAHELLAGVLGWFTEGTDTLDVRNTTTALAEPR